MAHTQLWNEPSENNDVTTTDTFDSWFGAGVIPDGVLQKILANGLTLLEVLGLSGGGEQALARRAVAALININSEAIDTYPMTQEDLVNSVSHALNNNNAAEISALTNLLNTYNTLETDWV